MKCARLHSIYVYIYTTLAIGVYRATPYYNWCSIFFSHLWHRQEFWRISHDDSCLNFSLVRVSDWTCHICPYVLTSIMNIAFTRWWWNVFLSSLLSNVSRTFFWRFLLINILAHVNCFRRVKAIYVIAERTLLLKMLPFFLCYVVLSVNVPARLGLHSVTQRTLNWSHPQPYGGKLLPLMHDSLIPARTYM